MKLCHLQMVHNFYVRSFIYDFLNISKFSVGVGEGWNERPIGVARTQTSALSEHALEAIRFGHNDVNRDSGIEIPEAWMPTICMYMYAYVCMCMCMYKYMNMDT